MEDDEQEDEEWENWNEVLDDEDTTSLEIEKTFKKN